MEKITGILLAAAQTEGAVNPHMAVAAAVITAVVGAVLFIRRNRKDN